MNQAERHQIRALQNLEGAVATMRQALDKAQQEINQNKGNPCTAAQRVIVALAWGHANAASKIETALSNIEEAHVIRRLEAAEIKKEAS